MGDGLVDWFTQVQIKSIGNGLLMAEEDDDEVHGIAREIQGSRQLEGMEDWGRVGWIFRMGLRLVGDDDDPVGEDEERPRLMIEWESNRA